MMLPSLSVAKNVMCAYGLYVLLRPLRITTVVSIGGPIEIQNQFFNAIRSSVESVLVRNLFFSEIRFCLKYVRSCMESVLQ